MGNHPRRRRVAVDGLDDPVFREACSVISMINPRPLFPENRVSGNLRRAALSEKGVTRFELWKVGTGHAFFEFSNEAARKLLPPNAKLVWSVEATSWEDARARMHRYLGWQPYKPARGAPVVVTHVAASTPDSKGPDTRARELQT
jgi:hypothetical protein